MPIFDPRGLGKKYRQDNRLHRIDRRHAGGLDLKDNAGRQIEIFPETGLQVKDTKGEIIHDTPDCLIASDMVYGGHLYWKDQAGQVVNWTKTYTDTETDRLNSVEALQNTDISAHLPSDLTNATGALILCRSGIAFSAAKADATTYGFCYTRYAVKYNETPATYNMMNHASYYADQNDERQNTLRSQALVPITYNQGIPYITWQAEGFWYNMPANNDDYSIDVKLSILGFFT